MTNTEAITIIEDIRKWICEGCNIEQPHNHIKAEMAFKIFLNLIRKAGEL
jgi:hypothetical protein